MKYYKLTDKLNRDEVVKDDNGKHYIHQFGTGKWIRSGIMIPYLRPEDDRYDQYTVICEDEAMRLLAEQGKNLDRLLDLAVRVAAEAHKGQLDKGGNPYILHPQAVAASLDDTENKIVAYLHDVVEDTQVTLDDLEKMGFTDRIVNSVRILTKTKGTSYDDYLRSIKTDRNARPVKMADIRHNMDISRIPDPTPKDFARIQKYEKALAFLKS